jgi:hypothetical protein
MSLKSMNIETGSGMNVDRAVVGKSNQHKVIQEE